MSHTHHNTHEQHSISNQNRTEFQNLAIRWKMVRGGGRGAKNDLVPHKGGFAPKCAPPLLRNFYFCGELIFVANFAFDVAIIVAFALHLGTIWMPLLESVLGIPRKCVLV